MTVRNLFYLVVFEVVGWSWILVSRNAWVNINPHPPHPGTRWGYQGVCTGICRKYVPKAMGHLRSLDHWGSPGVGTFVCYCSCFGQRLYARKISFDFFWSVFFWNIQGFVYFLGEFFPFYINIQYIKNILGHISWLFNMNFSKKGNCSL